MDELVWSQNTLYQEEEKQKFGHELGNEKYDWKKDFARTQNTVAHIINKDVVMAFSDFYASFQLPNIAGFLAGLIPASLHTLTCSRA